MIARPLWVGDVPWSAAPRVRTQLVLNKINSLQIFTAHPGEGRDPDLLAQRWVGCAQSLWGPHLSHSIWVPAFAGMSGIEYRP